jgi:hypothetical protein
MVKRLTEMNRRGFLTACSAAATVLVPSMRGSGSPDPRSKTELMVPRELAALLNRNGPPARPRALWTCERQLPVCRRTPPSSFTVVAAR